MSHQSDLRLIKLQRRDIHKPDTNSITSEEPSLTMDYFDALIIEKISLDKGFGRFMGLNADMYDSMTETDVSMQSIPIYCPGEAIDEWSGASGQGMSVEGQSLGKGRRTDPCCGDPFDVDISEYPYLSVVQVYITPEAISRIEFPSQGPKGEKNNGEVIRELFFNDIYSLIGHFNRKNQRTPKSKDGFIYRVYHAMSSGNFSVIIRSRTPSALFFISTLLKKRNCFVRDNADNCKATIVLYKTYSILSMNSVRVSAESNGYYIIRCSLSNRIWHGDSKAKELKQRYKDILSKDKIWINGRYDITVKISESEFAELYPDLYRYKIKGHENEDNAPANSSNERAAGVILDHEFACPINRTASAVQEGVVHDDVQTDNSGSTPVCSMLKELIKNELVTRINERYVLMLDTSKIEANPDTAGEIRMKSEDGKIRYLKNINRDEIKRVAGRLYSLHTKMLFFNTSRKSFIYSMELLKSLIDTCRAINGISETRIYCAILTRQIDTVLDGVYEYYNYIDSTQNNEGINYLDRSLKESIAALDSYAKLIRNNNLEAMQTPNYNLESRSSVDKVLMAYSSFLSEFISFYGNSELSKAITGLTQNYNPIVVMEPLDSSLTTIVNFNRLQFSGSYLSRKLMVIGCPSFLELTDICGTIGILFHEVGHSFRYEKREDRNQAILSYSLRIIFDLPAQSILYDIKDNVQNLTDVSEYAGDINECLKKAYEENVIYYDSKFRSLSDMSFQTLSQQIKRSYDLFCDALQYISDLDQFIRQFTIQSSEVREDSVRKAIDRVTLYRSKLTRQRYVFSRNSSVPRRIRTRLPEYQALLDARDMMAQYISTTAGKDILAARQLYVFLDSSAFDEKDFEQKLPFYQSVDAFCSSFGRKLSARLEEKRISGYARKIARYLQVADYETSGGLRDLSVYALSHLIHSRVESYEYLDECLENYRECASDLFMINMLRLTPFGYLNFVVEHTPIDSMLDHIPMRRIMTVLFAICGAMSPEESQKEKEDTKDKDSDVYSFPEVKAQSFIIDGREYYVRLDWSPVWQEIYRDMVRSFIKTIERYKDVPGYGEDIKELLGVLDASLKSDITCEEIEDHCKYIEQYIDYLRIKFRETYMQHRKQDAGGGDGQQAGSEERNRETEDQRILFEMSRCRHLCIILRQIIFDFTSEIYPLLDMDYMIRDFFTGNINTQKLRSELKNNPISSLCETVGNAVNHPEYRLAKSENAVSQSLVEKGEGVLEETEKVRSREEINEELIRSVINLYYLTIRKNALDIRKNDPLLKNK